MKTLIELYDSRPLENILSVEVFRPETVVYLCPTDDFRNGSAKKTIEGFFAHRGIQSKCVFYESSLLYAGKVEKQLNKIIEEYEDCVIDITGGTDAALFAAGEVCAKKKVPVFTYSRKQGKFYNIANADEVNGVKCEIRFSVEDFFVMAGGSIKKGRIDNGELRNHLDVIDPFFEVYLENRKNWKKIITYIQRISKSSGPLNVSGSYCVKEKRGREISADENALRAFEKIGLITELKINRGKSVSFNFADGLTRFWLRDIGSVLEVYVYKACLDSGLFSDVVSSAVVEWGDFEKDAVINEIDVIAVEGTIPIFISCKTCQIDTDALNELTILKERFGGMSSEAMIISTENCRTIAKHRASKLGIGVTDLTDISNNRLAEILKEYY